MFFKRKEKKNRKCSPKTAKIDKTPKQANCFELKSLYNRHYYSSYSQSLLFLSDNLQYKSKPKSSTEISHLIHIARTEQFET